jgi:hypothetical protein
MTGEGRGPVEMRGRPAEARREHVVEGLASTVALTVNLGKRAGPVASLHAHDKAPNAPDFVARPRTTRPLGPAGQT